MSKVYSKLRPVFDDRFGLWSVYATFHDPDNGEVEWEVPEWAGLLTLADVEAIIVAYASGTLPAEFVPAHPLDHT